MAIGKNKRISKGKKGIKKKVGDAFSRKEWYDLKAPSIFSQLIFGKTLVNKTQGNKLASDSLKDRVYEVNLADLNNDEDQSYRKIKLRCEEVQGRHCLTDFHAVDTTRHSICSLIRKWHTLLECHVDVKTSDGYVIRVFTIASTQRRKNQVKSTCYLLSSKAKLIRKQIKTTLYMRFSSCSLMESIRKLSIQAYEKNIESATRHYYPLQNIWIRKIKILVKPKFDVAKFMELHTDMVEESGKPLSKGESKVANKILKSEIK